MNPPNQFEQRLFSLKSREDFSSLALEIFHFQSTHCKVYKDFIESLNLDCSTIKSLTEIPFLPIEFFKSKVVVSGLEPETKVSFPDSLVFESSGTSGMETSKHLVLSPSLYKQSILNCFESFFGAAQEYCFLALLPSYLERNNSSLVFMVNELIKAGNHLDSGFYLNDFKSLSEKMILLEKENQKTLLIGVSFALLDFADWMTSENRNFSASLKNTSIMETGGMKGKRKEIIREDLHKILCEKIGVEKIYSEYGMTELLSQAYSKGEGIFKCPPWMRILIRDTNDPFSYLQEGKTGGINVIDLANLYSCSFIATQDLGKKHPGEKFEVLGRFDFSDLRGCNLLSLTN